MTRRRAQQPSTARSGAARRRRHRSGAESVGFDEIELRRPRYPATPAGSRGRRPQTPPTGTRRARRRGNGGSARTLGAPRPGSPRPHAPPSAAVAALAEGLELGDLVCMADRVCEVARRRPRRRADTRAHGRGGRGGRRRFHPPMAVLAGRKSARARAAAAAPASVPRRDHPQRKPLPLARPPPPLHQRRSRHPRGGELVAAEGGCQCGRAVDAALLEQRPQLRHQHPQCLPPGRGRSSPQSSSASSSRGTGRPCCAAR